MSRKLASIQTILEIAPIEGADAIEVVKVLGWNVVVSKNEFKVGDKVVFYEIDSFLPIRPEFEFLRARCYRKMADGSEGFRLKTVKLKGQLSQGLITSMSILPPGEYNEGDEVTELIGVTKYEVDIPVSCRGLMKGNFPGFLQKTDEERVQNLKKMLTQYKGTKCYVTEKVDGTSVTFYVRDGEFGVCSRNNELKLDDSNLYVNMAKTLNLEEKMKALNMNFAIQGEIYGEGIQSNPLKLKGQHFAAFNVFDINAGEYVDFNAFKDTIGKLELNTVPIIDENYILDNDIDAILEYCKGNSQINKDRKREGVVFRSVDNIKYLNRLSFKAINNDYLLKVEQ